MTRPFSGRKDGLSLSEALPDRSLFALVAMMGFLAALTLAGASGARALSARWSGGAAQLLTIQVPDANAPLAAQGGGSATTTRVQAVLADLASLPDGTEVHQLTPPELARLLEPWLGETDSSACRCLQLSALNFHRTPVYLPHWSRHWHPCSRHHYGA